MNVNPVFKSFAALKLVPTNPPNGNAILKTNPSSPETKTDPTVGVVLNVNPDKISAVVFEIYA